MPCSNPASSESPQPTVLTTRPGCTDTRPRSCASGVSSSELNASPPDCKPKAQQDSTHTNNESSAPPSSCEQSAARVPTSAYLEHAPAAPSHFDYQVRCASWRKFLHSTPDSTQRAFYGAYAYHAAAASNAAAADYAAAAAHGMPPPPTSIMFGGTHASNTTAGAPIVHYSDGVDVDVFALGPAVRS